MSFEKHPTRSTILLLISFTVIVALRVAVNKWPHKLEWMKIPVSGPQPATAPPVSGLNDLIATSQYSRANQYNTILNSLPDPRAFPAFYRTLGVDPKELM